MFTISQTNFQILQDQKQSQLEVFNQLQKPKHPHIIINGKSFDTMSVQIPSTTKEKPKQGRRKSTDAKAEISKVVTPNFLKADSSTKTKDDQGQRTSVTKEIYTRLVSNYQNNDFGSLTKSNFLNSSYSSSRSRTLFGNSSRSNSNRDIMIREKPTIK